MLLLLRPVLLLLLGILYCGCAGGAPDQPLHGNPEQRGWSGAERDTWDRDRERERVENVQSLGR